MNGKSGYVYKEILNNNSFCLFQALLTSKKNLMDVGLLDENVRAYQEYDLAIRLAEKYEFVYIDQPLFIYHVHQGQRISGHPKRNIDSKEYLCHKYQLEFIKQLGIAGLTEQYKNLVKRCLQSHDKRAVKYLFMYAMSKINLVYIYKK